MTGTAYIALLRGVNVGGNNPLPMARLREICEGIGCHQVRTYIQSGNVVFRTRRTAHLASRLEDAIEAAAGFRPAVMVRTAAELRAVAAANPFPAGFDPAKLAVHFLSAPPGAQLPEIATPGGETMHLAGRELFVYYPEGMGRSKLPVARLERALGVISTARNWNTLLQLIDLAEAW